MYSSIRKDLGIRGKGGDGLKEERGRKRLDIWIKGRKRMIQKKGGDGLKE